MRNCRFHRKSVAFSASVLQQHLWQKPMLVVTEGSSLPPVYFQCHCHWHLKAAHFQQFLNSLTLFIQRGGLKQHFWPGRHTYTRPLPYIGAVLMHHEHGSGLMDALVWLSVPLVTCITFPSPSFTKCKWRQQTILLGC